MTPDRWQRIEELFEAARACTADQRASFLDAACVDDPGLRREVESLLAYDDRESCFVDTPVHEISEELLADRYTASLVGRRVGPYQVVRELGRGGMGAVYLAIRADDQYRKQVAVKIIKRGMDTEAIVRRFRNEQQILADLDHPNIAKLLDGGMTDDGLSYFIMDYIEGLPIDVYCDTKGLSVVERLKLFRIVCSAVQYAHDHRIIHRDLKPGNILVTAEGVPKLLDFGIAKILDPERRSQTIDSMPECRPMTPEYASPEQVRGEAVTPVSDVYSLGVLLYELLTGQRPYSIPTPIPEAIERAIYKEAVEKPSAVIGRTEEGFRSDDLPGIRQTAASVSATRGGRPDTLRRQLVGDLDNIALKALHKEPERRYVSVEQFSDDIGRHLEGRPVRARSDTLGYCTAKFIRRNKAGVLTTVSIVALLLALIAVGVYRIPRHERGADKAIYSLAVLPLENFSRDPEQEYFADGMTEALITDLAQIGALRVPSRTSVMPYKGARRPLPEIGQTLKVDAVIEGSVQRAGNRVRVTVQLSEAATDRHLWAKSYEGDLSDVLALQSQIARAIAQEVKVQLTPQEQMRLASARPVNQEVYEAYLMGRYFCNKTTPEGIKKGIEYFEQAIAKDPNYALAYAGLADGYALLGGNGYLPTPECFPRAKAAATRALAIDGQLGEAHNTLGAVKMTYEWDWSGAEREFQRAIELNPRYALAHSWYSLLLIAMERRETAIAERKRALELDPLSLMNNQGSAAVFYWAGQYDEAVQQARKVIEMDPNYWQGHWHLGRAYVQKGKHEEAIAELQKAVDLSGAPKAIADLGHAYAASGKRAEAEKVIGELEELSKRQYVSPL